MLAASRYFRRCEPVARLAVTREVPDAVQAFGVEAAGPAAIEAARLGVPLVFDDAGGGAPPWADHAGRGSLSVALRALRRRGETIERRARRAAAACVASSDSLADDAVDRFGGRRPHVVRDCPPLRRVRSGDGLRRKLGIAPSDRIVVFHGRPDGTHGVETAIRAVRVLGDRVVLVVLGAAWCQDRLLRLAADEGVLPQVRVLTVRGPEETLRYLASAEVGVLPLSSADREQRLALPSELLDAFMAGLPMVVPDAPETGSLVRRTRAGIVVPSGRTVHPNDVAHGVRTLLSDPVLRASCCAAALRAALRELNWERESERLVDLHDRISSSL
jgi:glycosyltransferase involved in cell wall biosynthesis